MSFFRVIQHLLPRGAAWLLTADKALRRYFAGLAKEPQTVREFFDGVLLDAWPQTTRRLSDWEEQFGIPEASAEGLFSTLSIPNVVLYFDPTNPAAIKVVSAEVVYGSNLHADGWTDAGLSATYNQDGLGGTRFTVTNAAAPPAISQTIRNVGVNATRNPPCELSVEFKAGTIPWLMIETRSGTAANRTWFNLASPAVGTNGANHSGASVSAPDADGYRRLSVTMDANGGAATFRIAFVTSNGGTTGAANGQTVWLRDAKAPQPRVWGILNLASRVWWYQGDPNLQPGYEATSINGQPAVRGYGAQYFISTEAAPLAALNGNDPAYTLIYAVKYTALDNAVFGIGDSGSNNHWTYFGGAATGMRPAAERRDGTTTVTALGAPGVLANNTPYIQEWWSPGTTLSHRSNATLAPINAAAFNAGTLSANRIGFLARVRSTPDAGVNGAVGRLVLVSREVTEAERVYLREGFARKYSISDAFVEPDGTQLRRDAIAAAWAARGGQSKPYLDSILQAKGFDVTWHPWWSSGPPYVARDPRQFTHQGSSGLDPHYLVNKDLSDTPPPDIPSDPATWPYWVYVHGATYGERAVILHRRRAELEREILKVRPLRNWVGLYADFRHDMDLTVAARGAIASRAIADGAIGE